MNEKVPLSAGKGFAAAGRLKKAVIWITAGLVAAGIGFPYFKGLLLKNEIKKSVTRANQTLSVSGRETAIAINAYQVRYLKSEIEWSVRIPLLKPITGSDRIILKDRIRHTFSNRVVSSTSLEKNQWYKKWLQQLPSGQEPVSISSEYYSSGNVEMAIDFTALSFMHSRAAVSVAPGSFVMRYEKGSDKVTAALACQGMRIKGDLEVKPFSIALEMKKRTPLIWTGSSRMRMDDLTVADRATPFRMSGFTSDCDLAYDEKKSVIALTVDSGWHKCSSHLGDIEAASGTLHIENIPADAFETLVRSGAGVKKALLDYLSSDSIDREALVHTVQQALAKTPVLSMALYERLLQKGLKLELSGVTARTVPGDVKADIGITLNKRVTPTGLLLLILQPSKLPDLVSLRSDIQLPYTLVGYRPELVQPLFEGMQTGLFLVKEDLLVHQARTQNNHLYINHKKVMWP